MMKPAGPTPVPFHTPHRAPGQADYVMQALRHGHLRPGGPFSRKTEAWLAAYTGAESVVLTHSCTAAMEIAALALGLGAGDEVIVPTFTFCATATAFERTGARIVFCDIDPATMMMDPDDLERRISDRTKVIVVTHYGGASANMEAIGVIADKRSIHIVEDAAQGFGSTRNGCALGTFGTFGAFSFHETKVVSCGQGGALIVNTDDPALLERVSSIVERGTDHARVKLGVKSFYEWTGPGSSFLLGELEAAILLAEFEALQENLASRTHIASMMIHGLEEAALPLAVIGADGQTKSNFHFIPVLAESTVTATHLKLHLKRNGIDSRQHYVPLHLSPRAREMNYGPAKLPAAEQAWGRLLRLPVHTGMRDEDITAFLASLEAWRITGCSKQGIGEDAAQRRSIRSA
ncbi:aminotransferase class V-fold PLP-dependent enzyme [Mesorhizobium sp. NBSH29]|uniref:aminotransferase class V-fold PLP-dependent enzyme n=1 Tax=Mesorhizobium sp. NBSH29 TaxID=2654249 RepID=UPI0018967214|nr:aminotransferase class V-fold PLP-dependent enzyme [Mesorhizobium sp. NBSH29]